MLQRNNGKTAVDFSVFSQYLPHTEFETVADCNLDVDINVHACDMGFGTQQFFFQTLM